MKHIDTAPESKPPSKRGRRATRRCPSTRIIYHEFHVVSISRQAFEVIADQPIFDDHQTPAGSRPITWRDHLQATGPPPNKQERVDLSAGLLDRVVTALRGQGVGVRGDRREEKFPTPWNTVPPDSAYSKHLRRAHGRLRSLHLIKGVEERISVIAEVCKLQPETHVLVVVKNDTEAKKIAGMLSAATGRMATWKVEQPRGWPWLLVKNLFSLSGCTAMWNEWEYVIFFDAELALPKAGMEFVMLAQESPRIGFLTRDEHQLLEHERAVIEAIFGPVLADNADWAGISVAWLRPTTCKPMPFSNMLDRKRKQVWKNNPGNQLVAHAARSLRDNDSHALEMVGLPAAATWLQKTSPTEMPTVTVLVENSEHGQQLARLLPSWRLEEAGYTPPPGKNVMDDKVIMTLARAAETVLATTIIVFAAAGNGWWLEHRLWGLAWGVDTLIVDVADAYDERSRAETRFRAAGYRRRRIRDVAESDPPRETAKPVARRNRKQQAQQPRR
jgi:hypothetical protein